MRRLLAVYHEVLEALDAGKLARVAAGRAPQPGPGGRQLVLGLGKVAAELCAGVQGALGALGGVEIGARCTGWVEGPNAYPCGFALRDIGFTAQTVERHGGIVMDWTPNPQRAQAAIDARPHADMKGLMSPLPDTQRYVGMHVAPRLLGDPAKAVGRKLEFEIRAVSNRLVPSLFDHASGLVALCGAGQKLAM